MLFAFRTRGIIELAYLFKLAGWARVTSGAAYPDGPARFARQLSQIFFLRNISDNQVWNPLRGLPLFSRQLL